MRWPATTTTAAQRWRERRHGGARAGERSPELLPEYGPREEVTGDVCAAELRRSDAGDRQGTRKGRTVARGSARPGRTGKLTIKLRRTLRRGTYRVAITLRDARGAKRTLTKSLKVRR